MHNSILMFLCTFIDIDECALGTDTCDEENADCMDIDGSFSCLCHTGYSGDGDTCCMLSLTLYQFCMTIGILFTISD